MNRREALSSVGLILGGTIIGSQAFLVGCTMDEKKSLEGLLNDNQIALLNEIGETILPKTDGTPGAKEVNVGEFMNAIVSDFYTVKERKVFMEGVKKVNALCKESYGDTFENLSVDNRSDILLKLEKQAGEQLKTKGTDDHYFIMFKQLTIWAYLSSEAVAREAFHYVPIPGTFFENCVSYIEGDRAMLPDGRNGQAKDYATHHMIKNA